MVGFYGLVLKPDKIIGCSGVKSYSTGPAIGDFVLGFDIYCNGNTIKHCVHRGYPIGYPQGEAYENIVHNRRKEFLSLWEKELTREVLLNESSRTTAPR